MLAALYPNLDTECKHSTLLLDMPLFHRQWNKGGSGGVWLRAPTKSYDLGVHDRLIDEEKVWPSQLLFKTTSEFKTSEYSLFR